MSLSEVRNPFVRRGVIIFAGVPLIIVAAVWGGVLGALLYAVSVAEAIPVAWRGPPQPPKED